MQEGFPAARGGGGSRRLDLSRLRGAREAGFQSDSTEIGSRHMSDYKLFQCVQCGFEYDEALGCRRTASRRHQVGRHFRGLELPGLRRCKVGLHHGGGGPRVSSARSAATIFSRL